MRSKCSNFAISLFCLLDVSRILEREFDLFIDVCAKIGDERGIFRSAF